jgi:hypothetical protein
MSTPQLLLTETERDALTLAILAGDMQATPAEAEAITQWACQRTWQAHWVMAALEGRCGLRAGPEGVDLAGITAPEILHAFAQAQAVRPEAADEGRTCRCDSIP